VRVSWAWGAAVRFAVAGLGGAAQKGPERPAPKELPYDRAVRKYLADRAAELERDMLPGIRSEAALEKARPGLRAFDRTAALYRLAGTVG
jgi:hypothetical protein